MDHGRWECKWECYSCTDSTRIVCVCVFSSDCGSENIWSLINSARSCLIGLKTIKRYILLYMWMKSYKSWTEGVEQAKSETKEKTLFMKHRPKCVTLSMLLKNRTVKITFSMFGISGIHLGFLFCVMTVHKICRSHVERLLLANASYTAIWTNIFSLLFYFHWQFDKVASTMDTVHLFSFTPVGFFLIFHDRF